MSPAEEVQVALKESKWFDVEYYADKITERLRGGKAVSATLVTGIDLTAYPMKLVVAEVQFLLQQQLPSGSRVRLTGVFERCVTVNAFRV